jgi:hypothetical protein
MQRYQEFAKSPTNVAMKGEGASPFSLDCEDASSSGACDPGSLSTRGASKLPRGRRYFSRSDMAFFAFFSFFCLVVSFGWFDLALPFFCSLLATRFISSKGRYLGQ